MLPTAILRNFKNSLNTSIKFVDCWFNTKQIRCLDYLPVSGVGVINYHNNNNNNKYYAGGGTIPPRNYSSNNNDNKKSSSTIHLKTIKRRELIKDVLEKKREKFIAKKNVFVKDIRATKTKVKEKVREKMEEVIEKENILTIPNALTIGRGILSPYIGYVIIQGDFTFAMVLLVAAGITDLLDGQIARNWPKQASKFGSFMDPMADKLLVGSLVISMGYCNLLPIWLSSMILFRDIFLIGAGFVIRYISLPPPKTFTRYFDATNVTAELQPTFISKVNTAVQLGTIGISLGAPIWNYIDHTALHGLWYLTGITTFAAALSYVKNKNTYKILKQQRENNKVQTPKVKS